VSENNAETHYKSALINPYVI